MVRIKTKIILLSTILLISCGSRKVNKSETKETESIKTKLTTNENLKTETEVNTNVKETKSQVVDKQNNVVSEVTEITPIDATKESVFTDTKGQKYNLNNSKYRNEKTIDLSKEKSVSLSKYELIQNQLKLVIKQRNELLKQNAELKKQLNNKQVDKNQFNYFSLWWLYLLIILLIYFGWKNRKELFL